MIKIKIDPNETACPLLSMFTIKQMGVPVACAKEKCQWYDKCKSYKTIKEPPFGLWEADMRVRGEEE